MFITPELETILPLLDKLEDKKQPSWGSLTAQGMVEHLTDTLQIANGSAPQKLAIPEEKALSMQRFLDSDKEMARNISVPFAPKERVLRNETMIDAIDEFTENWLSYEEYFDSENKTSVHPIYGEMDFSKWQKLNSKHLTHHFKQFGLID